MSHLDALVNEPQPTSLPWNAERALSVLVSNALALAAIMVGAVVSNRADNPQDALLWLNVSIAGLAFAGIANGTWIMRARRTLTRGRALGLALVTARVQSAEPPTGPSTEHAGATMVWAPGTARYHRPDCSFVRGRAVDAVEPDDASDRGLRSCEVCRP